MLRAREIQVFTQHFEQRLMRRKSYFGFFTVKTKAYLSFAVHQKKLLGGGVFLLHFIQDGVVDQTRLADKCRDGNERRPLINSLNWLQSVCITDSHVIQTCARL